MKQFPLSRIELIKIRDTDKSNQVRILLREISRLHGVVRALSIQIERIRLDVANGRIDDDIIFDAAQFIVEQEMRLYGPPPYNAKMAREQVKQEAREKLINSALERESYVRQNKKSD